MVLTLGPLLITVTWVERPRTVQEPERERLYEAMREQALFLALGLTPPSRSQRDRRRG